MMKISTRLFAASALAAMLICVNQGAFAHEPSKTGAKGAPLCAMCLKHEAAAKTGAKGALVSAPTKKSAKTLVNAKVAPKRVALKTATTGAKAEACPMCAGHATKAKK